jgi:hypothetical protein
MFDNALPASSRSANTARHNHSGRDLANPFGYGLSGKPTGSSNPRNASVPQGKSFAGSHQSPTPFVKKWPHTEKLSPQGNLFTFHLEESVPLFIYICNLY